jgi:nucleoside-diphosphate-sugar epimerase
MPERRPAVVTGASGFIGDRTRIPIHHPLLEVRQGGFSDPVLLPEAELSGATVFHLAAVRRLLARDRDPYLRVNLDATVRLARHCCGRVGRFVNVSTAVVFASSGGGRADETALSSRTGHAYVESKRAACVALESLVEDGLPLVSVFPAIVYGPDAPSRPNWITGHLRHLLRSPLRVRVGRGEARRTLVEVGDVVRGILLAEGAEPSGERFILGGSDASQNELDALALRLAGRRARPTVPIPAVRARRLARLLDAVGRFPGDCGFGMRVDDLLRERCFSSDKAAAQLGFCAASLEEGVARTVRWLLGGEPATVNPVSRHDKPPLF